MEYKITEKLSKEVIQEILEVKQKKGLTAEAIVNQAKNKKSKLHNLFEWDNSIAAERWRLQQARVLINEVKVIVENKEYYAFENLSVSIENDTGSTREYFERHEIMSNEDMRRQVVNSAYAQLIYWREKYRQYNEFEGIFKEIDAFEKRLKAKAVA